MTLTNSYSKIQRFNWTQACRFNNSWPLQFIIQRYSHACTKKLHAIAISCRTIRLYILELNIDVTSHFFVLQNATARGFMYTHIHAHVHAHTHTHTHKHTYTHTHTHTHTQVACGLNLTVAVTRTGKVYQMGGTGADSEQTKRATWEGCTTPTLVRVQYLIMYNVSKFQT